MTTNPIRFRYFVGDGNTTEFSYAFNGEVGFDTKVDTEVRAAILNPDGTRDMNPNFAVLRDTDLNLIGKIRFAEAPVDGAVIWIYRETPQTQEISFRTSSGFSAADVQTSLDKLTRMAQEIDQHARTKTIQVDEFQEDVLKLMFLIPNHDQRLMFIDWETFTIKITDFTIQDIQKVLDEAVRSPDYTVKTLQRASDKSLAVKFSDNTITTGVTSSNVLFLRAERRFVNDRWITILSYSMDGTEWLNAFSTVPHNDLLGREEPESHPASAIANEDGSTAQDTANIANRFHQMLPTAIRNVSVEGNTSTVSVIKTETDIDAGTTIDVEMPLPVASETQAGVMNPGHATAINEHTAFLDTLNNRAFSASGLPEAPTQAQLTSAWEASSGITIAELNPGIELLLNDIDNARIWMYFTDIGVWATGTGGGASIGYFTNTSGGIIHGSTTEGKVFAEPDGTGSVSGWDALKAIANNAWSWIQTNLEIIAYKTTDFLTAITSTNKGLTQADAKTTPTQDNKILTEADHGVTLKIGQIVKTYTRGEESNMLLADGTILPIAPYEDSLVPWFLANPDVVQNEVEWTTFHDVHGYNDKWMFDQETGMFRTPDLIDFWKGELVREVTGLSNGGWYRIYKSGWVQQGGSTGAVSIATNTTVTFPIPMANTNYTVLEAKRETSNTTGGFDVGYDNKTVNTVMLRGAAAASAIDNNFDWAIQGFAADVGHGQVAVTKVVVSTAASDDPVSQVQLAEFINYSKAVLARQIMDDPVVFTSKQGTNWFRVHRSGWIEQGGLVPQSSLGLYINLLVPMADTSYHTHVSRTMGGTSTAEVQMAIGDMADFKEVGRIRVRTAVATADFVTWSVSGFADPIAVAQYLNRNQIRAMDYAGAFATQADLLAVAPSFSQWAIVLADETAENQTRRYFTRISGIDSAGIVSYEWTPGDILSMPGGAAYIVSAEEFLNYTDEWGNLCTKYRREIWSDGRTEIWAKGDSWKYHIDRNKIIKQGGLSTGTGTSTPREIVFPVTMLDNSYTFSLGIQGLNNNLSCITSRLGWNSKRNNGMAVMLTYILSGSIAHATELFSWEVEGEIA